MRREVLGRGSVGIRLAFLSRFGVPVFCGSGLDRVVMFTEMFAFRGGRFIVRSVLLLRVMSFVLVNSSWCASSWCSPPGPGIHREATRPGIIRDG